MLGLYRHLQTPGCKLTYRLGLARCLNAAPDELVALFVASAARAKQHNPQRRAFHGDGATPAFVLPPPVVCHGAGRPISRPFCSPRNARGRRTRHSATSIASSSACGRPQTTSPRERAT